MISFLLINFFPLIKLFLFILIRIFLLKNTLAKGILITMIILVLYLIIIYPRKRLLKLSNLRKFRLNIIHKYKFNFKRDRYYNILILLIYFILFFVVIFILRVLNKNKSLDLIQYYFIMQEILVITPWVEIILNSILFILGVILYFILIIKVIKYFKFHVIKRHIFNMNSKTNFWYQTKFFHEFLCKKNVFALHRTLRKKIETIYYLCYFKHFTKDYGTNFDTLSYKDKVNVWMKSPVEPSCLLIKYPKIHTISEQILLKGHYFLLTSLLFYDIVYKDYVITKVYYVLPLSFFYEIYLRISLFSDNLHLPYDERIHELVYAKTLELYDKDIILIDGEFYDYNNIKRIYKTYIARDFIKDKNDIY